MALRVALLGFYHETNTFSVARTDIEQFAAYQLAYGADVLARYRASGTELGGMIREGEQLGFELVPILFAAAVPSGLITAGCLRDLLTDATKRLEAAGTIDGVLLVLHGAAAAEGSPDADGAFLKELRRVVGNATPLVATIDFHANVSADMVAGADALVGYDTYPHTDMDARGAEAARLLLKLSHKAAWHHAFVKLPLITAPQCQSTEDEPMRSLMDLIHRIEQRPGVATASIAMGFAYADSADLGASVLVYGEQREAVRVAADEIAASVYAQREAFDPRLLPPQAIAELVGPQATTPVVLVDPADNVGGGSAGDGTVVLAELLRAKAKGAVIVICDPIAAAEAKVIGIGGKFERPVGGRTDAAHGAPLVVSGTVTYAADSSYRHSGTYMTGFITRMGLTAIIEVDGVRIVMTSLRTMPFDVEQLRCLGIEPTHQRVLVVKAAIAWRAAYGPLARSVFVIDTPGICPSNLHRLAYRNRPRPLYPLETDAERP
jgi:microcystin degradation protein MlrC